MVSKSLFDDMIEGVQIIDEQFRYYYVNKAVAAHAKSTVAALTGKKMVDMFPGIEHTEVFELIKDCMDTGANLEMRNEFDFPDGSKGYFDLKFRRVPQGVLLMSIDVTNIVRANKILEKQANKLEGQVNKQTLKVEEQNKIISTQLDEMKLLNKELLLRNKEAEEFLYIASHDLNEPLNTIISFLDIIKKDYEKLEEQPNIEFFKYIDGSIDRMQELIKDLLEYSRIGHYGEIELIDTNALIKNILDDLSNVIKKSKAQIEIDSLPNIKGSKTEMRLLFQNLISNAIKFRKKDVNPKVKIGSYPNQGLNFYVKDNGIGVDEKHFDRIFKIFTRLNKQSEFTGTGIGLAYCNKIVKRHGGEIKVESKLGEGSTFSFTLKE